MNAHQRSDVSAVDSIRLRLSAKSAKELAKIMQHMKVTNPTHMMQLMISVYLKSLNIR